MAILLVVAYGTGILIFRESKAIWEMESSNATSINSTFNMIPNLSMFIVVIIVLCLIYGLMLSSRAF